ASVQRSLAREVRGIVGTARSTPDGALGIGAERPAAHHAAGFDASGRNGARRTALLHPGFERGKPVEARRAGPARTMGHAPDHEEGVEALGTRGALWRNHSVVVFDAALRRNAGIVPSVIMDQLAAPLAEGRQVRVGGVDGVGEALAAQIPPRDPRNVAVE